MAPRLVDFVVAGAGPAGSRVAELLARRGGSVMLLDPKAPWEKPCGGGLSAAALRHTPELAELRNEAHLIHELLVTAPSGASVVVPLRSPYLTVNRVVLAQWGIDRAVAAGAWFRRAAVDNVRATDDGWRVTDSRGTEYVSRWLIAADGAASGLRPILAPGLTPERLAARVTYPLDGAPPGRAVLRFLAAGKGYAWDFPRRGCHSVGIAVPAGEMNRFQLDAVIDELRASAGDVSPLKHSGATLTTWDWSKGRIDSLAGASFALLGDAAGLADPVTGEGIHYALRSARLAADTFDESHGFRRYPRAVRRTWRPDQRRARLLRRWFYRPHIVERLVRAARRSPDGRGAALLGTLANAMNEHEPVGRSARNAAARMLPA